MRSGSLLVGAHSIIAVWDLGENIMKRFLIASIVACGLLCAARAGADVTLSVDPSAPWQGFMNVSELPSNGGAYVFSSSWGTSDLVATFAGPTLTLAPNSVNDPSNFWYTPAGGPGATGNKTMDANMYVESTTAGLADRT